MGQSRVNTQGITRIKCVAVFLVALIHVVALPVNEYGKADSLPYWWSYSIGHLGVPLFVMCSGALLLQEKYGNWQAKGEIKRRLSRILVPLLVYGWVYAMIELVFEYRTIALQMPLEALIKVVMGESWAHLWYLYMLLGLYIVLPCVRHIHWGTNDTQKCGILVVLAAFGAILPVITRLFGGTYGGANLLTWSLPATVCYILLFWTGALITQTDELKKVQKYFDAVGIISLLVLILWPVFVKDLTLKNAVLGYNSIFVWLSAAWVFSKLYSGCNMYCKAFSVFEKYSFGVYLIHPFFMNILYKAFKVTPLLGNGMITIPLFAVLFIALSLPCVWLISRVPIAKKWLI